jgi:hypothetical protein
MSFRIKGSLASTFSAGALAAQIDEKKQAALVAAAEAAKAALEEGAPVDTGALIATAETKIEGEQVTIQIAATLDGKPYGAAQESGWHDRHGGYHDGHHMVENAALAAKKAAKEVLQSERDDERLIHLAKRLIDNAVDELMPPEEPDAEPGA